MNLDGNGFNVQYPDFPNINLCSPYGSIIRGLGIPIHNTVDVDGVGVAEVITNVFSYTGEFILNRLWAVITDATEITAASAVYFDIWDGSNTIPLTAAAGVDCSGANVHSVVVKDGLVAAALTLMDADQVRYDESAFNKAFVGGIVGHKAATTCYVRLRVTCNADTDLTWRVYMSYSPMDFDTVVAVA